MLLLAACGGHRAAHVDRWVAWAKFRGDPEIWIARADGSERRLLVRKAFAPMVSPDGRWVAFAGCLRGAPCLQGSGALNLFVVAARGGERRLLGRAVFPASWSPRSDRLVGRRGNALVSIALDSAELTELRRGAFEGWSFSPGGDRVVYARMRPPSPGSCDEASDLYTQPTAGGPRRRVTHDGRATNPVWGSDWIAFTHSDRTCAYGRRELWLVRPDGSGAHRLARPSNRRPLTGYYGLMPIDWRGSSLLGGIATEWGDIALAVDPRTGAYHQIGHGWYATGLSHDGKAVLLYGGGAEAPWTIGWIPFRGGREHVIAHGDVGHESWNR
jgi:hypothetical protein